MEREFFLCERAITVFSYTTDMSESWGRDRKNKVLFTACSYFYDLKRNVKEWGWLKERGNFKV